MPIRLNRLGSRLDLHNDQPWAILHNQVHLKLSNSPIRGQHLPTSPNDVFQSNPLTPSSNSLMLCFHAANIARSARSPRYFCLSMCSRCLAIHCRLQTCIATLLILSGTPTLAQPGSTQMERAIGYVPAPKGNAKWYAHWGYHRAEYGKTDLRLIGPGIELTLHDIKATDMPEQFDPAVHLNPSAFTNPQFNARVGRRINQRNALPGATWVSLGWDHLKYKVPHAVHQATGVIDSLTYQSSPFDWASEKFNFEHSDGMNFIRLAIERDIELGRSSRTRQTWDTANQKWRFGLRGSASLGVVVCATDVRWMGTRSKHFWHISGWGGSAIAGAWVQFGQFRALARIQSGWLEIGDSRFLNSVDRSGENPAVSGPEAALLDASRARHAMPFLEKGVTIAFLFGRKGQFGVDERIRTAPSR